MKEHYPLKSARRLCKRLKYIYQDNPIFPLSVKMLRISLTYNNIDNYRSSNNRCHRVQGNNTGLTGQDTYQIAQQSHRPTAQNSNRQQGIMIGSPQYHASYMRHSKTDKCNRSTESGSYGSQQTGNNQEPVAHTTGINSQVFGITLSQQQGIQRFYQ